MKHIFLNIKQYILAHKILSAVVLIVVGGGTIMATRPAPAPTLSTATVARQTLVQSVEETGSLETGLEVSYGFETSGRVTTVHKKAGDIVVLGDVLAELDGKDERAALAAAQASYAGAVADLNKQLAGGSDEDRRSAAARVDEARAYLAQAQADRDQAVLDAQNIVDAAQTAVDKAKNNLQLATSGNDSVLIKDAYDDLVNTLYGVLSDMDEVSADVDTVLGYDNVYANDEFESVGSPSVSRMQTAIASYMVAKEYTQSLETALYTAATSGKSSDKDVAAVRAQTLVSQMRFVVRDALSVLANITILDSSRQSTLDGIVVTIQATQSDVNTSAATLTAALQAVTAAKNSVSTYQIVYDQALRDLSIAMKQKETTIKNADSVVALRRAGLDQAQAAYDKVVNPPREIDLASIRAEVNRRGAEVSARLEAFNKTKLVARTAGVIGRLDVKVGESALANTEVVTILSEDYLVKVDIAESDITKVSVQDPVALTFDAAKDREFRGRVIEIDASKTEISGVVYYKTTIAVDAMEGTDQLRSGMTVDVAIETDKVESVLVVPRRAIVLRDGKKYIRVVTNKERGQYEEREIQTGLSGDDGLTEVTAGVEEGQEIVTFVEEKK